MGELETEEQRTRAEVAATLRELADQLDDGGEVTLELGSRRVTVDPAEPITLKLEGESDWAPGEPEAKQSIEFEMVWRRAVQADEDASLNVEQTGQ
jgi:amphi-Trp domain-containing protein